MADFLIGLGVGGMIGLLVGIDVGMMVWRKKEKTA